MTESERYVMCWNLLWTLTLLASERTFTLAALGEKTAINASITVSAVSFYSLT